MGSGLKPCRFAWAYERTRRLGEQGKTRTPMVGFFTEFDIRHVIPLESLARLLGCVGAKGRFLVVGLTQGLT